VAGLQVQVFGIPTNGASGDIEILPQGSTFGFSATLVVIGSIPFTSGATTARVNQANNQISVQVRSGYMHVAIDVVGYFARPQATALDCVNTGFPSHVIAANSNTYYSNPACPAGYQATLPYCYTAALGVYAQGNGHINDVQGAQTFCAWHNTTASPQTVFGGGVCCRVPGR
jgi:hypothetical protein